MLHLHKSTSQSRIPIFWESKLSRKCANWIQHPHQSPRMQTIYPSFQQCVDLQAVHVRGAGYPQHLPPSEVSKQPGRQAQWGQEMRPQRHPKSHSWEVYKVKTWVPSSEVITQLTESLNKTEVTLWTGITTPSSPHPTAYFVYPTSCVKWSLSVQILVW